MLTFVEHHPVGLFLWCQAQALLSLRQPLIDDSSSHGSPFRNFRNNSVISTGEPLRTVTDQRSEEHTSELQSLMRISYAVFCLKKKKHNKKKRTPQHAYPSNHTRTNITPTYHVELHSTTT